jgi:sugar lactone lactonase YvrE
MAASVMRVSLAPPRLRPEGPSALAAAGARVILGAPASALLPAESIVPSACSLFGPRGACVTADGALWVADTGHHRLLGWRELPTRDGSPADWLIGQADFTHEGRNGRGDAHAASVNVPTGICACGEGLAVADAWNHRLLIWGRAPRASHVAADVVLGQADFSGAAINRGADRPAADTLYWPYGVHWDGASLWVADSGNRRVLRWRGLPRRNGTPADLVLGQRDFGTRDENAGAAVNGATLRWPHALAHWRGNLCVADAGNNRVLIWHGDPAADFTAGDRVIGQADMRNVDHNRGEYWPCAASLNMPYGVAAHGDRLFVADTANSRILRFDGDDEAAAAVGGQTGFVDKGENRWQPAARDSLCWPYAVTLHGDCAIVADSGNNRVLLWDIAR